MVRVRINAPVTQLVDLRSINVLPLFRGLKFNWNSVHDQKFSRFYLIILISFTEVFVGN